MLLDNARSLFAWEFAAQGEKTITATCATAVQYAQTEIVFFKAMDQDTWMATYDRDPATGQPYPQAISSLRSWLNATVEAARAGVTLIPWVVPGHSSQAPIHAQLGPRIVIDAEPYRGFWADTPGDFLTYIQALRGAGLQEIYVSTDPRRSIENALDETEWAPWVAALLPQIYWTDFQQPYQSVLPLLDTLLQLNPNVVPVLPFDGAADFPAFWQAAQAKGIKSACLWKLGSANTAQLQAFGQLAVAAPPPVDPCLDLRQQLLAVQTQLTKRNKQLDEIAAIMAE